MSIIQVVKKNDLSLITDKKESPPEILLIISKIKIFHHLQIILSRLQKSLKL